MPPDLLSVEQAADRLGLHVRTVRGYIRGGRLKAVRIGKQYRIAVADLDTFIGRPARPTTVEVSTVVEVADIDAAMADRLGTALVAGAQTVRSAQPLRSAQSLRLRAIHDETYARLKIIIMGGARDTADVLLAVDDFLRSEHHG